MSRQYVFQISNILEKKVFNIQKLREFCTFQSFLHILPEVDVIQIMTEETFGRSLMVGILKYINVLTQLDKDGD